MGSFLHKFLHTDCKDNIQWFSFSAAEVSAQRIVDSMKGLFNSTVLRFTRSKTSNGPNVHVYLFATDDARDSESVKRAAFVACPENEISSGTRTAVTLYLSALGNGSFSPLLPD
jgi:hypothetical protein